MRQHNNKVYYICLKSFEEETPLAKSFVLFGCHRHQFNKHKMCLKGILDDIYLYESSKNPSEGIIQAEVHVCTRNAEIFT